MQAFTVPCSSSLFFLVEMLPCLSSSMYRMFWFFLIEGGIGYLPFKKRRRKIKTHKMGGNNQCTRIRLIEPGTTLKWAQCLWSEEALLPALSLMLPYKSSSGDVHGPLVMGTQELTKESYLLCKKWLR